MLKRKLIAYAVYDLETADSSILIPSITLYWDVEEEIVKVFIVYDNQFIDGYIEFEEFIKIATSSGTNFFDYLKTLIRSKTDYTGKCGLESNLLITKFGHTILVADTKTQITNWIKNNEKF